MLQFIGIVSWHLPHTADSIGDQESPSLLNTTSFCVEWLIVLYWKLINFPTQINTCNSTCGSLTYCVVYGVLQGYLYSTVIFRMEEPLMLFHNLALKPPPPLWDLWWLSCMKTDSFISSQKTSLYGTRGLLVHIWASQRRAEEIAAELDQLHRWHAPLLLLLCMNS